MYSLKQNWIFGGSEAVYSLSIHNRSVFQLAAYVGEERANISRGFAILGKQWLLECRAEFQCL